MQRRLLGALFAALATVFVVIGFYAAREGGLAWVIAATAGVLAVWMGEQAYRALR